MTFHGLRTRRRLGRSKFQGGAEPSKDHVEAVGQSAWDLAGGTALGMFSLRIRDWWPLACGTLWKPIEHGEV